MTEKQGGTRRPTRWAFALLGAALLVMTPAGCAGGSATPGAPGSATSGADTGSPVPGSARVGGEADVPDLNGLTLVATEVRGQHTLVPASTITLTFQDGQLSARAGCNTMVGPYTMTDGAFTARDLASTMIACAIPLMQQDTWLAEFLASSPWTYTDGTLTLSNRVDTIALSPPVTGAKALQGSSFRLTGLLEQTADARSSTDPGVTAWIAFEDGLAVHTSCNSGRGTVEMGDGTMTFGPIVTTRIACPGRRGEVEQAMLAVLEGTVSYTLSDEPSGAVLTIMSEDGTRGLRFVADPTVRPAVTPAATATAQESATTG